MVKQTKRIKQTKRVKNMKRSKSTTRKNMRKGRNLDYIHSCEGRMAKSNLYKIAKYSQKLHDKLYKCDDLPEWILKKIYLASDYMSSVYHYLDHKIEHNKEYH